MGEEQLPNLINNYKPTEKTIGIVQNVPKILIAGIAGAGKNAIIDKLLKTGGFRFVVSHVTRASRKNNGVLEKDGVDYHFVDTEHAIDMLKNREFVEAKWVHRQNIYATSPKEFEICQQQQKIAIADVNVEGVGEYMNIAPDSTKVVFILPPDFDTWQQRFKARYEGRLGEGEFQNRLRTASEEIKHVLSKNYFSIVINDNLDDAVTQVQAIAKGEPQSDHAWRHGSMVAHELLDAMRNKSL